MVIDSSCVQGPWCFFTEFIIVSKLNWPEFWERGLFCSKRLLTRHHHHFERGSLSICGEHLENLQGGKSSSGKATLFSFSWSGGLWVPDSPADTALLWATQPGLWLHTPPARSAPESKKNNKKTNLCLKLTGLSFAHFPPQSPNSF